MSSSICRLKLSLTEIFRNRSLIVDRFPHSLNLVLKKPHQVYEKCKIFIHKYQEFLLFSRTLPTKVTILITKSKSVFRHSQIPGKITRGGWLSWFLIVNPNCGNFSSDWEKTVTRRIPKHELVQQITIRNFWALM